MKKIFTSIILILLTLCVSMVQAGRIKLSDKTNVNSKVHASPLTQNLKSKLAPAKTFANQGHQNPKVNSGFFKPGHEALYYWDGFSSWNFNDSTRYTYNSAGNTTLELHYDVVGALSYRTTHSYNVNGNLALTVQESWNGTSWDSVYQEVYSYNGNKQLIQDVFIIWMGTAWSNSSQVLYTYGPYGETQEVYQTWDGTTWVNTNQFLFTYNTGGQVIMDVSQNWNSTNSVWDNTVKEHFTYDLNGKANSILVYAWSGGWQKRDSVVNMVWYQWVDYWSNDNKWDSYVDLVWDGLYWRNSEQWTYTYDAYGNETNVLKDTWDTGAGTWMKTEQVAYPYLYDAYNNITQELQQNWDTSIQSFVNYQRIDYGDYLLFTNVTKMDKKAGLSVYPNPSEGVININISDLNLNNAHLSILNSIGEEVYTEEINSVNSFSKKLDLHAPSGIYFVKITSGEKEYSQKILFK